MPQLLHLLIVDRSRRAALASRYGQRWLLPVLSSRERTRIDPLITRWLAEQGVTAHIAGHWLGRVTPAQDSMDWLVAIDASPGNGVTNSELAWTPLNGLVSTPAVLEYQHWAVSASLGQDALPSVRGPFGNLVWLDDVKRWIAEISGESQLGPITAYRATSHEVVLGVDTMGGRLYFKGLTPERAVEVGLTVALSELAPRAFAKTLVAERRSDGSVWWLQAECAGRDLARCLNPQVTANVAGALACLQRDALSSAAVLGTLEPVNLPDAAGWAADLMGNKTSCDAIERACAVVTSAVAPQTWIPLDLDPANVLVDNDGLVSFIDLDDSFIGPAPLAMAMFARRSRNRSGYEQYEKAWFPFLRGIPWPGLELAAAVVDAWLGWKRVVKNTDRGEVHGVLEIAAARLARRLTMAITGGRSPCPTPAGAPSARIPRRCR